MTNNHIQQGVDVYALVTNRIIELLEKGVVPWQKPWTDAGIPRNLISGKNYRGINVWLLNSFQFQRNLFLTYNQAHELGGNIKRGEKSIPVVFWKWLEKENTDTKEVDRIPLLRYYNVFNIEQTEGIPKDKIPPVIENNINPIESCEKIIAKMPKRPIIFNKEHKAYYNRVADFINVPQRLTFKDSESYYATLFHELVHSTGHKDRLNRKELLNSKGYHTEDYAIEELTAEMGASYLKSQAGIPMEQLENNASYISYWLGQLKNDKRFIVHASAQAQKATDFILNLNLEKEIDPIEKQENKKFAQREGEVRTIREVTEKLIPGIVR